MSGRSPSHREGHQLMQDSISQIHADLSSMRSKYKAAVTHASHLDSVSPVFSPGDSPSNEGHREAAHSSTPKQSQGPQQEDRRALLRSRSPIRSVIGKPHSTPSPTMSMSTPTSTHRAHDSVEFSSSDGSDAGWVGDQMVAPGPRSSSYSHTSRHLDWTSPMTTSRPSPRSPTPTRMVESPLPIPLRTSTDSAGLRESLSASPSSLLEEAQMHRTVMQLEKLFGNRETQQRLQQIRAVQGSPRTPQSESRYEKLERATAEKRTAFSPTMWAVAASDSAFASLVPPYGEQYSPYARQMPHSTNTTVPDFASTPTLQSKPGKSNRKKSAPKSKSAAPEHERAYPYEGAKTWRESCRVRGPLARYTLHEAPSHTSKEVGSVKSGGHVEVLRTDIGHGFGARDKSSPVWVLLAQGGWLRAASQFCSPSYGEWLAQGGDGTDSGPIAVLQTVERPGRGAPFTSKRQPKRGPAMHTRPFYT
jgi:hypothetical protein